MRATLEDEPTMSEVDIGIARTAYLRGTIDVEEFERRVDEALHSRLADVPASVGNWLF